jgi:tRNA dimethylallyltransferase
MPLPATAPILIAGPTASGKSAFALRLAELFDGVVINADAMQVYAELPILSARPSPEDEARAPHWLYGHISASVAFSVGRYVLDMQDALDRARHETLRPIIVGGTGLYFKALLEGLSPVPAIDPAVRQHWRGEAQRIGAKALHAELSNRDPEMAARLASNDTQRLTRALEVLDATGHSLAYWQQQPGRPLLHETETLRFVLRPDRATLLTRCDTRLDQMMDAGALAEVAALIDAGHDAKLPAMGALGVAPLAAHLRVELSLESAVERAKLDTRQYVKRQLTWLKRNMSSWNDVQTIDLERNDRSLKQFIDCCSATA